MSNTATIENEVATPVAERGVPHAIIPALPPFELTFPPGRAPSREDFLIAEMERRFRGRAVRLDLKGERVADLELYRPSELQEPEWTGGFRGEVGKLLWRVHGLQRKAIRFLSCNKLARPGVCSNYPDEHKYFIPNGCDVIFCRECADESRRELLMDYLQVVCNAVLDFAGERKEHERLCKLFSESEGFERQTAERLLGELWARVGQFIREKDWVLWRVTFTLRSDGSAITPKRVKAMNACVGAVMRRTVRSPWRKSLRKTRERRRGVQSRASGCPFVATADCGESTRNERVGAGHESETALSPRKCFGLLFVDEVGFEKRGHLPDAQRVAHGLNLHAHGLYFGPRLDWERTRDLWMEVTREEFGVESRGFFYTEIRKFAENPGRAIRWALNHMLKYVSKPPAVTPERLASLIAAFDGARRVHSLGLFYGKKPERERKDCPCPKCRAMGIVSALSFEGRMLGNGTCIPRLERVEELLARGYVPLREAGRDAVFEMGASREDSWGASP
jgi:hypothetical protein